MSDQFDALDPSTQPAQESPQGGGGVDAQAVQSHIAQAVQQWMQQHAQPPVQQQPPPPQYIPVPQAPPPQIQPDPIRDVINPYLAPVARHLALQSELAQDAAVFYPGTPEALPFRDRIEQVTMAMANMGRPATRQQVFNYLKGGELFNHFVDSTIKQRQEAAERARGQATLGPGMVRGPQQPTKDAFTATDQELMDGLKGIPF